MKCQKVTKVKGGFYFGTYKQSCQKEAVIECSDGRMLCQHHYNKWLAKMEKHNPKEAEGDK